MSRQRFTILSVSLAAALLTAGAATAGNHYFHRNRTRTRCCIPKHNYGHETPRYGATQFAVANATVGVPGLRHKPFHFRATALTVDQLQLDKIGLSIYESDGKLIASGRITNSGGDGRDPEVTDPQGDGIIGGLIGNNVRIRIRAFVASAADPNEIPPDAVVVWESERELWVSAGRPQYISLVPKLKLSQSEKLQRHFDEITHLQVEMEYLRDR